MKGFRVSIGTILSVLMVGPAVAEEGRIPIFEPTTITAAGSYVLTRDIDATGAGSAAILVTVGTEDDVTIDLNGFAIIGQPGLHGIQAANLGKLEVRNGTIKAPPGTGPVAITVIGAGALVVEDVAFLRRAFTAQPKAIYAENVRSVRIRDNVMNPFSTSTMYGINIVGDPANPTSGLIENNEVFQGGPAVIVDDTKGLIFRENKLYGQTRLLGSEILTVEGNSVLDNQLDLGVATGCTIKGNMVTGANAGIILHNSSDCLIANNVLTGNDGAGLALNNADRCRVTGNVVTNNGTGGIVVNAATNYSTFSQNQSSGNGPATLACTSALVETCPAPYGGGSAAPDVCVDSPNNYSACDNFMPGPPRS